ncbi:peptidase domain-containing ABC transporter [Mucilaginibacter sabulilitoris]|uniref:Peptidase domain-containing ABC transporter n=1 Tax=Mucilaginibacter sabulilitoris TaxID=1173583 RepID=A0ABZ0TQT4_9SPHI|nr:peptidase domain-containing ABC transporter [Mucilaginibacter sabulilitoris]WPU95221.1 peptidase domain-containing ABC transporter [Mucilaginibacter sabulilitoris]
MGFTYYKQLNIMDCGPTCLRMVAKHYGKNYNMDTIRQKAGFNKEGVSLLGISETAEKLGFRTRGVRISYEKLQTAPLPAILHWKQNHFVVLISIDHKRIKIADPERGMMVYSKEEFTKSWISNNIQNVGEVGTVLLMEPTAVFYELEDNRQSKLNWGVVATYLKPARPQIVQIFISLLITSLLQMILPFLTQTMVDTGINTRNLQYITIVLIAQLTITFSSTVITFIRNRLQLRISNTINISILSDFWIKITRLPVAYFDSHHTGDTLQRLEDNKRIQSFLTSETITTIFAILNFFVYALILTIYSVNIFLVFVAGNLIYFGWIRLFMRIRRKLNYETFHLSARENNATLQMIQGMQEIRLNNAEKLQRWEWEHIQVGVFKLNFKSLNYSQLQSAGAQFISQGKDILLSFMVAQMVIKGELTFGTMLAVQYIIGQLSGPINQFISLLQNYQDAKISMERLNEIHEKADEEPLDSELMTNLPEQKDIVFNKLTFAYPSAGNEPVLKDLSLVIPEAKVTAIVGTSGSGKTTLLKMLLKIHNDFDGELKIGSTNFKFISPSFWRKQCGAVLQDGYIFNDTIARNISVGEEYIDNNRLLQSARIANILSFIETLPNGFHTKLGADGTGVSQGQKQRILIARAVYKDPKYLFFDEATNALDANNEKAIVENLQLFFEGRTVVIVAHRLSTVKSADKIIVLKEGTIVEEGNHDYLTHLKGHYYELVKNQLELGS